MAPAAITTARIITCQIRQMEERRQGMWEELNIPGDGRGAVLVGS